MTDRYAERMASVSAEAVVDGFDAVLVAPSPDLVYLTGYDPPPFERATVLILRPGVEPVLIVPELERPLAASCPVGDLIELVGWPDGVDPYALAARLMPATARMAANDRMWAAHLLGLQAALPEVSFASASRTIGRVRSVKDDDELAALRDAGAAADSTFDQICAVRFAGRTELELAADLASLLVENGHERADFTIVASGPNAASPHHEPGARRISPGEAVVLDFGGRLRGYCSDTTRTVVVAEAPPGFDTVHALVKDAQEAAFASVAPGVPAQEIDRAARRPIADAGYADRFVHRTGHGIGLEVHEPPYLVEGNEDRLEPGTTFSIEPGVYLEGRFGVRIEDIVAVTPAGAERLNRSARELRVVE